MDAQYGTEQDLRDFTAAAHKLGLKVMLDVVYYHTAPDSVMRNEPDFLVKTDDGRIARGFWPQPLPDFKNPRVRSTWPIRSSTGFAISARTGSGATSARAFQSSSGKKPARPWTK